LFDRDADEDRDCVADRDDCRGADWRVADWRGADCRGAGADRWGAALGAE